MRQTNNAIDHLLIIYFASTIQVSVQTYVIGKVVEEVEGGSQLDRPEVVTVRPRSAQLRALATQQGTTGA